MKSTIPLVLLKGLFWGSLGALAWTHAGYPAAAAALARLRPRRVRKADLTPQVTVVVAAHDEETVIGRRLENLLELEYPADRLEILVASDGSTDRTDEVVEEVAASEPRIRLLRCPRAGKVAAQNRAVAETSGEIVAFSDANSVWEAEALAKLVRSFADPEVAYVSGLVNVISTDGTNREGAYWQLETWLREQESMLGSITAGNGGIYAVRRDDYVEVDPRAGHDLGLPYRMVERGRRAVYEPEAVAHEKAAPNLEDEYSRKVRMLSRSWQHVFTGRMLRGGVPRLYALELVSHRVLRYASGLLHLGLLGSSLALAPRGRIYRAALLAQLAFLADAARRPGIARYYTLVTWSTIVALAKYLRSGAPQVWEKTEGMR